MKLFVANLPHKLEEAELKKMLTQFGQVASVKLKTDEAGKRKGWGFIEMPVEDQAKAAIAALNEKEVHGRRITLKAAEEKEPQRRYNNFQQRNGTTGMRTVRSTETDGEFATPLLCKSLRLKI
ncbi:RNA-binding protein [Mucilaginibacter corticis]|uniref:RNA-binding protein n=1 Tax=Mucilaginibacter corticis TaxID=2597670 RepID=A0A556MX00_9SPHI|nr:RNA-binding protein [Mucilaginibacter corticis]TSJ44405.1 RNA-binding protein [Mucilaginibacter corticis]